MDACAAATATQDRRRTTSSPASISGKVEPNARIGTDPERLDSYTERFRAYQLSELLRGHAAMQFTPFPQDRRLRQPAARRPVAARRPISTTARCRRSPICCAAGAAAEGVPARLGRRSTGSGGFVSAALRSARRSAAGHDLFRHQPARQRQWRPVYGTDLPAAESGPPGLSPDLLEGDQWRKPADRRRDPTMSAATGSRRRWPWIVCGGGDRDRRGDRRARL